MIDVSQAQIVQELPVLFVTNALLLLTCLVAELEELKEARRTKQVIDLSVAFQRDGPSYCGSHYRRGHVRS